MGKEEMIGPERIVSDFAAVGDVFGKMNLRFPAGIPTYGEFWRAFADVVGNEAAMRFHSASVQFKLKEGELSGRDVASSLALARIEQNSCYLAYVWLRTGRKTFVVADGLSRMFVDTDCDEIPAESLRMPFPCIVVKISGVFDGWYDDVASFLLFEEPHHADGRLIVSAGFTVNNYLLEYSPSFFIPHGKTLSLGDVREETAKYSVSKSTESWQKKYNEECKDGPILPINLELWKFVANFLLYVSMPGADVSRHPAAEDAHKKLQGLRRKNKREHLGEIIKKHKNRFYVGRSILIDKGLSRAIGELVKTETGRKILKRFQVRGHFRRQPCGHRRSGRKLIWIKPHWKGPPIAEVLSKKYKVRHTDLSAP